MLCPNTPALHGRAHPRAAVLLCLLAVAACDGGGGPATDADADADADVPVDGDVETDGDADEAGPRCGEDEECDDGLFCDGEELCVPGEPGADDFGCLAGEPPSCDDGLETTADTCSEELGACLHLCADEDDDGHADAGCVDEDGDPLGDDCDDLDPDRSPGNVEVCDLEGHDEDCDPATVGDTDDDLDGHVSSACCNLDPEAGSFRCGGDCDDSNPDVNPDSTEFCDVEGVDEDCDGRVNEGLTVTCYLDADDDGFAPAGEGPREECKLPGRDRVSYCPVDRTDLPPADGASTDCDDGRPEVHPGAPELCDGEDDDCDGELAATPGVLDETDRDGDGFLECAPEPDLHDCGDDDERAFPGQTDYFSTAVVATLAPVAEPFDFDCDGLAEHEEAERGYCDVRTGSCAYVPGWFEVDPPPCGEPGEYVTGCGALTSACLPYSLSSRVARCH